VTPARTGAGQQADLAVAEVCDAWGAEPDGVWVAPGRINVIGHNVDYSGGRCLPLALTRVTAAAVHRWDGRGETVRMTPCWPARVGDNLRSASHRWRRGSRICAGESVVASQSPSS
jgi:galactokinase